LQKQATYVIATWQLQLPERYRNACRAAQIAGGTPTTTPISSEKPSLPSGWLGHGADNLSGIHVQIESLQDIDILASATIILCLPAHESDLHRCRHLFLISRGLIVS